MLSETGFFFLEKKIKEEEYRSYVTRFNSEGNNDNNSVREGLNGSRTNANKTVQTRIRMKFKRKPILVKRKGRIEVIYKRVYCIYTGSMKKKNDLMTMMVIIIVRRKKENFAT